MTTNSTAEVAPAGQVERGILGPVQRAFAILRFRAAAVDEALDDANAFIAALAIVGLAGVAAASDFGLFVPAYVSYAASYLVVSLLFAGLIHMAATVVCGARGDFVRFYRGFGSTYLALWIVGVPLVEAFFSWGLWIWQLAAVVLVAERAYALDRVRAVAVVAVPAVIALFVIMVFNAFVALGTLLSG